MANYETILTELDEPVLIITMNRPEVLNALNTAMLTELRECVVAAGEDPRVRCIVLTGAGRGFNAGADLAALTERYERPDGPALGPMVRELYVPLVLAIRTIEKPVIAAMNGVAAGAGASIALACDLRVASDRASIVEAFVRVGLIPDTGGTLLLPLLVGLAKASELAFTGARVDAGTALDLGLVNRVVPADELMPVTRAWAHELASLPTRAIGLTKRGFNHSILPHFREVLEHEADLMQEAGQTHDHREGVAAFLEKRAPVFRGI